MAKYKKRKVYNCLFYIVLLLSFFAFIYISYNSNSNAINLSRDELDGIRIFYFDVGQADSILIQTNNENMLIDAGNNADGENLVEFLKNQNITKFKYVFGTHAHEDHIGGLDNIILHFNVDHFYMPDVVSTTKTYEDILTALEQKQLKYEVPQIGDKLNMGDLIIDVIYIGNESSNNLNNTSIVLKLTYKNIKLLFMGDLESNVEKNILDNDLKSDVLKVGHHGSNTSSSKDFIEKVKPSISIISVGKNNKYNHPKKSTIELLEKYDSKVLRTDELGTIILTSDGYKINYYNIKTNIDGK